MATNPTTDALIAEANAARFVAYMNSAYHADREAFLDGVHRWLMFAVIVLGASALTDMIDDDIIRKIITGLAALAGTFDLVFDLSTRARKHGYLRRDYLSQAARLVDGSAQPSEVQAAMLTFSAEEEPPYYAAMALAENWASLAVYENRQLPCEIGWWARLVRHLVRFSPPTFARKA